MDATVVVPRRTDSEDAQTSNSPVQPHSLVLPKDSPLTPQARPLLSRPPILHIRLLHTCGIRGESGLPRGGRSWSSGRSEWCGTKAVPGSGAGRDLDSPDEPGVGLSLPDGVGRGRRRGARVRPRTSPATTPSRAPRPACSWAPGSRGLDGGQGVEAGSQVTEQQLFNLLGMCADPVTGEPLGRQPNRAHLSLARRVAGRVAAIPATAHRAERRGDGPDRGRGTGQGGKLAGAGGRVRPDVLPVQVGVCGLGGGRPGDQSGDLRLPPPGHRHRARLRRAGGVPLPFGDQRRRPRGR